VSKKDNNTTTSSKQKAKKRKSEKTNKQTKVKKEINHSAAICAYLGSDWRWRRPSCSSPPTRCSLSRSVASAPGALPVRLRHNNTNPMNKCKKPKPNQNKNEEKWIEPRIEAI
jgi:hypothetical protein